MATHIFTDGASKGNPGPGGWGAVIVSGDVMYELGGGETETTNNRMELLSAIRALESLDGADRAPLIFSDSSYVVNGITKWIVGWEKNGWKTKAKKDVLNSDLWLRLRDVSRGKHVAWHHVPGHSGIHGNERANDIAESFASGKPPTLFRGPKAHYPFDLALDDASLGQGGMKRSPEKKQIQKHRAGTAYSYVSLVDGTIEVHKTWEECKARVQGKRALFKKAMSRAEEAFIIKTFLGG
jgi:ribonuclease HI